MNTSEAIRLVENLKKKFYSVDYDNMEYKLGGDGLASTYQLEALDILLDYAKEKKEVRLYSCPVCGSNDPNLYLRCNRADCTDGRDPR